jgi:hypothetical protein
VTRREIYNLYRNLTLKCNPTFSGYPLWKFYGKLGVRFRFKSYDEFAQCIGQPPSAKYTLKRWPDTTGDYHAGNVRWMPPTEPHRKRATHSTRELPKKIINTTPAQPPLTPAFW